ncbi:cytochrome d ubiquinol oxidase subunit II [Bdellovibrionota bacterium FG-1]
MDLQTAWFLLLGALLAGYAVLDGFDLGVGILHLLARTDHDRRIFLNAIGPIWDGNEVWLVAFGGALFAAFPEAYATAFSGFYMPFMVLLCALIFRAVSIEFRSKRQSTVWRTTWDRIFFLSSLVATFLLGVAIGNSILGIPLDARGVFIGTFDDLFGPYPILLGLLTVAMFAMHGALYLNLKIPVGDLHVRMKDWIWHSWGAFLVLYMLATIFTLVKIHHAVPNFDQNPGATLLIVVNILTVANIPRATYRNLPGQAFLSSCIAIVALVGLFGLALWPNLVTASNVPENSLTLYRAASSIKTLKFMLVIAGIGMPLVLAYTTIVYWTFRKRVVIEKHSY